MGIWRLTARWRSRGNWKYCKVSGIIKIYKKREIAIKISIGGYATRILNPKILYSRRHYERGQCWSKLGEAKPFIALQWWDPFGLWKWKNWVQMILLLSPLTFRVEPAPCHCHHPHREPGAERIGKPCRCLGDACELYPIVFEHNSFPSERRMWRYR